MKIIIHNHLPFNTLITKINFTKIHLKSIFALAKPNTHLMEIGNSNTLQMPYPRYGIPGRTKSLVMVI